jgi:hypothetical protein
MSEGLGKILLVIALLTAVIAIVIMGGHHKGPSANKPVHSKTEKRKVTCYKVPVRLSVEDISNTISDFTYQYLMNDGTNYYSYESKTPVTNFSSVKWTESKAEPKEITEEGTEKVAEEEIPEQELSPEIQAEMESDVGSEAGEASDANSGSDAASDAGGDAGGDGGGGD